MPIFTETVTGFAAVEVYGGLTACKAYLGPSSDAAAVAFTALDDNEKKKKLIDATRFLERQPWIGKRTTPAVDNTTLKWPRTNVTIYEDGETITVDDQTVPVDVVNAAFEMAALLTIDPALPSKIDQSNNIASLGAGSAQISYFAPTSVQDGTATTLPVVIEQLIAKYQRGTGGGVSKGGAWFGASEDGESAFDECSTYKRNDPF